MENATCLGHEMSGNGTGSMVHSMFQVRDPTAHLFSHRYVPVSGALFASDKTLPNVLAYETPNAYGGLPIGVPSSPDSAII